MATPIPENRAAFSLSEIARVTGGLLSGADAEVRGVFTDSRAATRGSLFVALRGERLDGHRFVTEAITAGASAVMIDSGVDVDARGVARVSVDDTTKALGELASHHRSRWGGPVVAITGSAGKTSTKELVAAALGADGSRVLKTRGNLNNLVGVPMTLFCLEEGHDVAVVEMGTSQPGEIGRLGAIGRPDVAVITLVSAAHTEGLGSLADVAREKRSLLSALGPRGSAVLNGDDPELAAVELGGEPIVRFGRSDGCDVRLVDVVVSASSRTKAVYEVDGVGRLETELALLGETAALNGAAALAVVLARGGDPKEAAAALSSVRPTPGRLCLVPGGPFRVIDDSYNANPKSMRTSLEAARAVADASGVRLVAVIADMKELGAESRGAHDAAGVAAAELANGGAIFVGPEMNAAFEAAKRAGRAEILHVGDASEAIEPARRFATSGDVVLVKGSRSMTTERVVVALTAEDAS